MLVYITAFLLSGLTIDQEMAESYKAIEQIAMSPKLKDDKEILAKTLLLEKHMKCLDKHVADVSSNLVRNRADYGTHIENLRLLIEYTIFTTKFYEEKEEKQESNAVANSLKMHIVDFTQRAWDYTQDDIERWARFGFTRGYFDTTRALSGIHTYPEADINGLKQFLNKIECPQALRADFLTIRPFL